MNIEAGTEIGNYRIMSKIGSGGMGEVFLAEDIRLDRKAAVKFLNEELGKDADKLGRFIQEAKAASALNHPNIITVYEIGNSDGHQFIATEFIDGITLRQVLETKPITLLRALDLTLQIADALGAAHDAGIIHRDIKPENVMIRTDGRVKVLDFGLAKLSPDSAQSTEVTIPHLVTRSGVIVGTIAYMSPEQAKGRKLDTRSDIFSLGILMFEIFTGRRPFAGETHLELVSSILKDEPPLLRSIEPEMPEQLERIVSKTLRKDREHRYQDVRDLQIDIEDLRDEIKFDERSTNSHRTVTVAPKQDTHPSNIRSYIRSAFNTNITETRRFTLLHAIIFMAIACSLVAAVWYFRPKTVTTEPTPFKVTEVASWLSAPGEIGATANFSPDGKLLAFASTRSGTKDIWVTQATSTEAIQITRDGFLNTYPIWSPAGDEIAYLSLRPNPAGGNSAGLWRVSALGGGVPKSVANLPNAGAELVHWGKSGRLYYTLNNEVFALEMPNGNAQRISALPDASILIGISPDEKTIAYLTRADKRWSAHTADLDGTNALEIASGVGEVQRGGALVPEAKRLFFSVINDGASQIMSLDVAARQSRVLASPETSSNVIAAAPDGKTLLLSSAREEGNLWRVDLESANKIAIARDLNVKLWPSVSPDNSKIVYQSVKNLNSGDKLFKGAVASKTLAGGENERPTSLADQGFLPQWSPNGSAIAFLKQNGNTVNLFAVNPNGGGERQLTQAGVEWAGYSTSPYNLTQSAAYSWSPDGARIAFIANRSGQFGVWVVNVSDGAEVLLTASPDGSFFYCPIFSPDGRQLAFSFRRKEKDSEGRLVRGLMSIDLATNEVKLIVETTKIIRLVGWGADSTALIAAEASQDNVGLPAETSLIRFALAGGAETRIANLKNAYFYNIFLSEDKKQIAFAARDQNMDNLWIVPIIGGTSRRITNNTDSGRYYSRLAWLRDGRSIVFGEQTRYSLLSKMTDIE